VIIPVLTQHYAMLLRNLRYTGFTRGKKLVVLVGQVATRLYDFIHEPQGVRFGLFRLDREQRPHADCVPEKN
jgi:hypothetical protein